MSPQHRYDLQVLGCCLSALVIVLIYLGCSKSTPRSTPTAEAAKPTKPGIPFMRVSAGDIESGRQTIVLSFADALDTNEAPINLEINFYYEPIVTSTNGAWSVRLKPQ